MSNRDWTHSDRKCKACRKQQKGATEKKECSSCGQSKSRCEYGSAREWERSARKCKGCREQEMGASEKKACSRCGQQKRREEYASARAWERSDGFCKACAPVGHWTCIRCKSSKPRADFSDWLHGRKRQVNNGKALCNKCTSIEALEKKAVAAATGQGLFPLEES